MGERLRRVYEPPKLLVISLRPEERVLQCDKATSVCRGGGTEIGILFT
jgi:hypothetical protein